MHDATRMAACMSSMRCLCLTSQVNRICFPKFGGLLGACFPPSSAGTGRDDGRSQEQAFRLPPPLGAMMCRGLLLFASALALLRGARAQGQTKCFVPPAPAGTDFETCQAGTQVNANAQCKVACQHGSSQGAGTYTVSCKCTGTGADEKCAFDNPFKASCTACQKNFYQDTYEAPTCKSCPTNTATQGTGSATVAACLCNPGFSGAITKPTDTCTKCAVNTYKTPIGTSDCSKCPDNAVTAKDTSVRISDCLCSKGCKFSQGRWFHLSQSLILLGCSTAQSLGT
jgi:hypothetical protein